MVGFPIKTKQDQLFFNTKGNLIERSLGEHRESMDKIPWLRKGIFLSSTWICFCWETFTSALSV